MRKIAIIITIILCGIIGLFKVNSVAVMAADPNYSATVLNGHIVQNIEYQRAIRDMEEYQMMKRAAEMAMTPSEETLPPIEELMKLEPLGEEATGSSSSSSSPTTINKEKPLNEETFEAETIDMMAKALYGEANSVKSEAERSMVVWTFLNRLDSGNYGKTIKEILTTPQQFTGYSPDHPVTDRNRKLVEDVVARYKVEKAGEKNVGRTLPKDIYFFRSDSNPSAGEWHNKFFSYTNGNSGERVYYDYHNPIENPYEN